MKKIVFNPDIRALNILKICLFCVLFGVALAIIMATSHPTAQMAENCRQSLFACAFGADVAIGGFLYIDYGFKNQK